MFAQQFLGPPQYHHFGYPFQHGGSPWPSFKSNYPEYVLSPPPVQPSHTTVIIINQQPPMYYPPPMQPLQNFYHPIMPTPCCGHVSSPPQRVSIPINAAPAHSVDGSYMFSDGVSMGRRMDFDHPTSTTTRTLSSNSVYLMDFIQFDDEVDDDCLGSEQPCACSTHSICSLATDETIDESLFHRILLSDDDKEMAEQSPPRAQKSMNSTKKEARAFVDAQMRVCGEPGMRSFKRPSSAEPDDEIEPEDGLKRFR